MARSRTDKRTPEEDRVAWLQAFEAEGTVSGACKTAGVGRSTVYEWRQKYEGFALAWADLEEETTERMEREAFRRAAEGVPRDVYHQGQVVGEELQFSDTLLIFMLKSRRPEKYRDNVKVEHSGSIAHDLSSMTDEQLRALADGLDAKRTA